MVKYPDMVLVKKRAEIDAAAWRGGDVWTEGLDAETGTHVETWCITTFYIPIVALRDIG